MFDAADRKKLILQIALLLALDQKNRYYCPLYQIIRHNILQKCKEGTSNEEKCRNLGQQKKAEDDFPNPSASGGMVQFFKDRFYNNAKKW